MGALAALGKLVPVALAFGFGVFFAKRKIIGGEHSKVFSDFAFLFAIPCYLFAKIYSSALGYLFNWRAISAYAASAALCMVAMGLLSRLLTSTDARGVALRIMAGVQVNTAYFAVPVFIMLFGDAAPIFPILLLQVCLLSTVVLSILELGGAEPDEPDSGFARTLGRAVWASLNTPVVLSCNLAILFNLLSVPIPKAIIDGMSFVGDSAAPVALFALGLHLGAVGVSIRGTTREELGLIVFKCVLFPLVTVAVCTFVIPVHGAWFAYLMLIAAMPAPQNLFIFAQRYNVEVDLAASVVVKSSLAALLLLPLWVQWAHAG